MRCKDDGIRMECIFAYAKKGFNLQYWRIIDRGGKMKRMKLMEVLKKLNRYLP